MIVSGHQPLYLPWIGFLHKVSQCDAFVLVSSVQFTRKSWINRNAIKTSQGPVWLTVPVKSRGRFGQLIGEVQIANDSRRDWRRKHWQLIRHNYARAPFFESYGAFFERLYQQRWERLVDLNEAIIRYVVEVLGLSTRLYTCRELNIESTDKNDRILEICQKLGADTFLLGMGASKTYVDGAYLGRHKVNLCCQSFEHPIYPQMYGTFEPNLAIIDLLFNCGDRSRGLVINSGRAARRFVIENQS